MRQPICGLESLLPDDDNAPEVRIGPYKLAEKLGEGGMGTEPRRLLSGHWRASDARY